MFASRVVLDAMAFPMMKSLVDRLWKQMTVAVSAVRRLPCADTQVLESSCESFGVSDSERSDCCSKAVMIPVHQMDNLAFAPMRMDMFHNHHENNRNCAGDDGSQESIVMNRRDGEPLAKFALDATCQSPNTATVCNSEQPQQKAVDPPTGPLVGLARYSLRERRRKVVGTDSTHANKRRR